MTITIEIDNAMIERFLYELDELMDRDGGINVINDILDDIEKAVRKVRRSAK